MLTDISAEASARTHDEYLKRSSIWVCGFRQRTRLIAALLIACPLVVNAQSVLSEYTWGVAAGPQGDSWVRSAETACNQYMATLPTSIYGYCGTVTHSYSMGGAALQFRRPAVVLSTQVGALPSTCNHLARCGSMVLDVSRYFRLVKTTPRFCGSGDCDTAIGLRQAQGQLSGV